MATSNDAELLTKCRDACDKRLALCGASADQPALTNATAQMLRNTTAALAASSPQNAKERGGVMRIFRMPWRRVAWLAVYAITISCFLWWYEVRPIWQAHLAMQGDWQFTQGTVPEEQRTDSYLHVNGFNTRMCYPGGSAWQIRKSRISLTPARNYFIVRRQYDFGIKQNQYETEYVVRLDGDRLYILRGMARLDAVKKRTVDKLERVDELPPELRKQINDDIPH